MHIDHLVIIAGATASGKSSVIREIFAGRLHDIQARLGVHDFRHWACWNAAVIEDPLTTPLKYLVLEYDFLWHDLNQRDSGKHRAASLLDRAQEISFITVWTPPARLEKQFVDGRLRAALPPNWGGVLRSRLFRFLPRFAIRTLSGL